MAASNPPLFYSVGCVGACEEGGVVSIQGKSLHKTVLSQRRAHSCMRVHLMQAHFRGCDK